MSEIYVAVSEENGETLILGAEGDFEASREGAQGKREWLKTINPDYEVRIGRVVFD